MSKEINLKILAANAKNVARTLSKFTKTQEVILNKIDKLKAEYGSIQNEINTWEEPIRKTTNGLTSSDLIERVTVEGKSSFRLKYPETILPPNWNIETGCEDCETMDASENLDTDEIGDNSAMLHSDKNEYCGDGMAISNTPSGVEEDLDEQEDADWETPNAPSAI